MSDVQLSGATDIDLRMMGEFLQILINANTDEALARWKFAIAHTRRKQGQRWRWMAVDIAAQLRAAQQGEST